MSKTHKRILCILLTQAVTASFIAIFINITPAIIIIIGDLAGIQLATITAATSLCKKEKINSTLANSSRFCTATLIAIGLASQGFLGNTLSDFNPTFALIAGLINAFMTIILSINIFYANVRPKYKTANTKERKR